MWHFIFETVPKDHDVLLAVLDHEGFHALEFPCRRSDDGRWIDAATGRSIEVHPTHWREWVGGPASQAFSLRPTQKSARAGPAKAAGRVLFSNGEK
jgi:hypothetical protein